MRRAVVMSKAGVCIVVRTCRGLRTMEARRSEPSHRECDPDAIGCLSNVVLSHLWKIRASMKRNLIWRARLVVVREMLS